MKCRMFVILLLCFICNISFSQDKEELSYLNEPFGRIVDSLKNVGVDSIVGFGKFSNGMNTEKSNFYSIKVSYLQNGVGKLIEEYHMPDPCADNRQNITINEAGEKNIYFMFDILYSNRERIVKYFNNPPFRKDTFGYGEHQMTVERQMMGGRGQVFYFKLEEEEAFKLFCCLLSMNQHFRDKAFELWLLGSSFNNYGNYYRFDLKGTESDDEVKGRNNGDSDHK